MIITDMRMESEEAGAEVIRSAREAVYKPAIALLTAFPVADDYWQEMGADRMLVKPMHTRILLEQIEKLLTSHQNKKAKSAAKAAKKAAPKKATKTKPAKKTVAKKSVKSSGKKTAAKKAAKKTAKK
jgi:DNA-binding response OmpR family regulator